MQDKWAARPPAALSLMGTCPQPGRALRWAGPGLSGLSRQGGQQEAVSAVRAAAGTAGRGGRVAGAWCTVLSSLLLLLLPTCDTQPSSTQTQILPAM